MSERRLPARRAWSRAAPTAAAALLFTVLPSGIAPAGAQAGQLQSGEAFRQQLCHVVDEAAAAFRIPSSFLARVLWRESRLRSDVTSPAGAQGVAQFMPQTAAERGLADPYDAGPAITHAAGLLAELLRRFGNFGLAAAAYDAGAGRVGKWLRARADLPPETRLYVAAVTGRPIEDWTRDPVPPSEGGDPSCLTVLAGLARRPAAVQAVLHPDTPIGRALARAAAMLDNLARRQQRVQAAEGVCNTLRAMGAHCSVYDR